MVPNFSLSGNMPVSNEWLNICESVEDICLEPSLISFTGISEAVDSESAAISFCISSGDVGEMKKLFVSGGGEIFLNLFQLVVFAHSG